MTDEQRFHDWLKHQLMPCDYQRLENIGSGMPDANICSGGREIWCELKMFVNGRILLRKEQYAWGMRGSAYGRIVYILAQHPSREVWALQYPHIIVEPYGKYLQVSGTVTVLKGNEVKNYLFPQ